MLKTIKNIATQAVHVSSSAWRWLSGKKRWIAITAGLIAKLTPAHTFGHQAGAFIRDNAETIFEVTSAIAIGEIVIQKTKDKFPKGLRKAK
ncbi:MAG: hypothetical protein HYS25_13800 [Ignavibacteriales bacterium]|nr:hypothetical protein [Ignavibacteriales bacterium]